MHGIHYREAGNGPALLLLNHAAASGHGWRDEFLSELAETFRLLVLDHRGTGDSPKPDVAYLLSDLARDALEVLDRADVPRAHVVGLSMGGAVAQELTFAAPERVAGLVLVSTFCGPRKSVPPDPAVLALLEPVPGATRRAQIAAALPVYHSRAFIAGHEELLIALTDRGTRDTPRHTLIRQNEAIQQFDSYERLPEIRTPTLIIHGDADPIIPVENARILESRIPGARLEIFPGAGHVPMTEQPHRVARSLTEFLLPLS